MMLSQAMQDYLKAIYKLQEQGGVVFILGRELAGHIRVEATPVGLHRRSA